MTRSRHPLILQSTALVSAVLAVVAASGCSAAPVEQTATSSDAITNGTPVGADALGSVMLWQCTGGPAGCCPNGASSCNQNAAGFNGGCSATMVADRWMLTAQHCVTWGEKSTGSTALDPSTIVAISADQASLAPAQDIYLHPTLDVALVYLTGSIRNAQQQILSTPIYTGTSASLIGKSVYCQGFGYNTAAPPPVYGSGYGTLRSAMLHVDNAITGWVALDTNSSLQTLYYGDSGTACFVYPPGGGSPEAVYAVQSWSGGEIGTTSIPQTDDLVGADGFLQFALNMVAAHSCGYMGATCGTYTDPLGSQINCGTCGAGDTCERGTCECTPQKCKAPTTWDPGTCSCAIACHSAATCCAQGGGSWNGHSCE